MAKDSYHEILLHLVWHTKESRNLIAPEMENELYRSLRRRSVAPGGVFVHAIGGTRNQVHLAARIPPRLALAEWIGRIKGGSSYDINHTDRWRMTMDWQSGYGVVSFGAKDLPWVVDYVQGQKQHHMAGTIFDRLERITAVEAGGSSQASKPAEAG